MNNPNFGASKFGISWTTLIFVLLSWATLNVMYCIWMWKFINRVLPQPELKNGRVLCIVSFALFAWASAFDVTPYTEDFGSLLFIGGTIILWVLSFKTRPFFQQMLMDAGISYELKGLWLFIFPFYYQYYVACNAETLAIARPQPVQPHNPPVQPQPEGRKGPDLRKKTD